MKKILPQSFFQRPVLEVAPKLLGKYLARRLSSGEVIVSKIIEVEAYDGEKDLACHASKGKTPRTAVMYEPGGCWYIYLVYGMYHMLNIVTGEKEYPSAVLIRGIENISGPGRLTKFLNIDKSLNCRKAYRASGLWIEDREVLIPKADITKMPRIGVNYAGDIWSKKEYRFTLKKKPH